jgi:hypothetical protein
MLRALRERAIAILLRNCSDRYPGREHVASYGIVALFVVSWGVSFFVYRFKRYDRYAKSG